MQMISSKAGTRLARAQHALDQYPVGREGDIFDPAHGDAVDEWVEAATQVGRELIADNHHTGEGD